jgi:hypothetical protein
MLQLGRVRVRDARCSDLAFESRFDPGYNGAHSIALAALRARGYRSETRYLVFQCLQETLGLTAQQCRTLDVCHKYRNVAEYEGYFEVDEQLLGDMLQIVDVMLDKAGQLELEGG